MGPETIHFAFAALNFLLAIANAFGAVDGNKFSLFAAMFCSVVAGFCLALGVVISTDRR